MFLIPQDLEVNAVALLKEPIEELPDLIQCFLEGTELFPIIFPLVIPSAYRLFYLFAAVVASALGRPYLALPFQVNKGLQQIAVRLLVRLPSLIIAYLSPFTQLFNLLEFFHLHDPFPIDVNLIVPRLPLTPIGSKLKTD